MLKQSAPRHRPAIGANIVANFVGRAWVALIGLFFVPVSVRLMGIEAYGVVGVFTTLVGVMAALDLGLSATVNRELARSRNDSGEPAEAPADLVRTLEVLYWAAGGVMGACIAALAKPLALHWLHATDATSGALTREVRLMGLTLAAQWPTAFYVGALSGLQRQIRLNAIQIMIATARYGAVVWVLRHVAPTCDAFFAWQAFVAIIGSAGLAWALWSVPELRATARFRLDLLRPVWKYASSLTGISLLAVAVVQADKLILTRFVSLADFGYYTLAATVATTLSYAVSPITTATFPATCAAAAAPTREGLARIHHRTSALIAVSSLPCALFVATFARELVELWQADAAIADNVAPILRLLALAPACNAALNAPYYLSLATGLTRVPLVNNVATLFVLVPLLLVAVPSVGPLGAATAWLTVNIAQLLLMPIVVHRAALPSETWRWYSMDVALPASCAFVPLALLRYAVARPTLPLLAAGLVASVGSAILGASDLHPLLSRLRRAPVSGSRGPYYD